MSFWDLLVNRVGGLFKSGEVKGGWIWEFSRGLGVGIDRNFSFSLILLYFLFILGREIIFFYFSKGW